MRSASSRGLPWLALLIALQAGLFASAQATNTVSGVVYYGDTEKPASGINLWLATAAPPKPIQPDPRTGDYFYAADEEAKQFITQVAADGAFTLTGVPAGTYLVHIYCPPYLSPDGTVYLMSNTTHVSAGPLPASDALRVEVVANRTTRPIHVVLQRGGAIEGTVSLPPGVLPPIGPPSSPVSGFAVSALRKLGENSYASAGGAAHTDAHGHYLLESLAPGQYIVFVGMGNGLPIYAPATVRPSLAAIVVIQHAETKHLDVALSPTVPLHTIQGTVKLNGPEPAGDNLVRLFPSGEETSTASTRLTQTQTFSFENVPDGEYTIEAEFFGSNDFVGVDVAKGVVHMRITPSPYSTATHTVHVAGHDITNNSLLEASNSPPQIFESQVKLALSKSSPSRQTHIPRYHNVFALSRIRRCHGRRSLGSLSRL